MDKRGKIVHMCSMRASVEFDIRSIGSRDDSLTVFATLTKKGRVKLRFSTGCESNVKEKKFKRLVKKTHHPITGNRNTSWDKINYYEEYSQAIKKARSYAEKKLLRK